MCTVVATYTMLLQFRIFRLQYSTERICAAIGDISTTQWALHFKFGAKYSAHPPVYAMWTIVADIYNVFTAPHIEASIFIWTYLRCYWKYLDNSMRVILHSWCQILRTSSSLRYVNYGPGHIQYILLRTFRHQYSSERICAAIGNISTIQSSLYCKLGAKYSAHHPVYAMWTMKTGTYTKCFQHRIFSLQYSAVGICAAIVHITTIQCALYRILGAKYSAHPPVFAMWPVIPAIYKVFSAPHI
jgi:hypothetical protein